MTAAGTRHLGGVASSVFDTRRPLPDCERALALVCRIAAGVGISRRHVVRVCRQLRREGLQPVGDFSRAVRHDLASALRTVLSARVDGARLRRALADAVLLDEYEALPEVQRRIMHAVHGRHLSLQEAADLLGLPLGQATILLREALRTLSGHTAW
jgi:DNA-directed RNA polymerase specialized sigma24 family protein